MPRPTCPRHITHQPPSDYFKPAGIPLRELQEIVLAADEIEAIRLADVEDLYHTAAARRMRVSRQTFDRIVRRARQKIAQALVNGQALKILRTPAATTAASPAAPARKSTECCRAKRACRTGDT